MKTLMTCCALILASSGAASAQGSGPSCCPEIPACCSSGSANSGPVATPCCPLSQTCCEPGSECCTFWSWLCSFLCGATCCEEPAASTPVPSCCPSVGCCGAPAP